MNLSGTRSAVNLIRSTQSIGIYSHVPLVFTQIRTATKRVSGSKTNKNDSAGRRLGPKAYEGHFVKPGQIIMRQRGTKIHPGENVDIGKDHTIFAKEPGYVRFYHDPFHPLRKYVGVALKKDFTLPTPHFSPRVRRFGYEEILEPQEAQKEEFHMSRKEFLQQDELAAIKHAKELQDSEKISSIEESLRSLVELNEDDMQTSVQRMFKISQLVQLGKMNTSDAESQVTFDYKYSLQLASKRGDISAAEMEEKIESYTALVEKLYGNITVNANGNVIKALSAEEKLERQKRILTELESNFSEVLLTPETRKYVTALIEESEVFDRATQEKLSKQYLPETRPVWSMENAVEVTDEKKLKNMTRVYDESTKKVKLISYS